MFELTVIAHYFTNLNDRYNVELYTKLARASYDQLGVSKSNLDKAILLTELMVLAMWHMRDPIQRRSYFGKIKRLYDTYYNSQYIEILPHSTGKVPPRSLAVRRNTPMSIAQEPIYVGIDKLMVSKADTRK